MLIQQHGQLDADKAIEHIKQMAKSSMPEPQFARCNDIIEKAAKHFLKSTFFACHVSSWGVGPALAAFQAEKKLSGYTLIHLLEKVFRKKLPADKPVNTMEKAWDTFEKQYKLELITNLGNALDVIENEEMYFRAAGWTIAVDLSRNSD